MFVFGLAFRLYSVKLSGAIVYWYVHISRVVYLLQGEKIKPSSHIQIKMKNNKTETNGVEIIFNVKLKLLNKKKKLLENQPVHFGKKLPGHGREKTFF